MKIIIKKLNGGGDCTIDVDGSMKIVEVKQIVEGQLGVTAASQTLVFSGKTLTDNNTLESVGLKEGSKLHLISRKIDKQKAGVSSSQQSPGIEHSEDVFILLSKILNKHLTPDQSSRVLSEFRKKCKNMTENMNLEDIQRFANSNFTEF